MEAPRLSMVRNRNGSEPGQSPVAVWDISPIPLFAPYKYAVSGAQTRAGKEPVPASEREEHAR